MSHNVVLKIDIIGTYSGASSNHLLNILTHSRMAPSPMTMKRVSPRPLQSSTNSLAVTLARNTLRPDVPRLSSPLLLEKLNEGLQRHDAALDVWFESILLMYL